MSLSDAAAQTLKEGDPRAALARLQEDIRAKPSDAKLRVFLFQLLCILGQWDRALNQLKVASELDPLALPMAQMYGEAVTSGVFCRRGFGGKKKTMGGGGPGEGGGPPGCGPPRARCGGGAPIEGVGGRA